MRCLSASLIVAAGLLVVAPAHAVEVWVTTGDQTRLLEQRPDVQFNAGTGVTGTRIDLDPSTTYQTIDGFGAAVTDSSAWLIQNRMSQTQRDALMDDLFSRDTGIGLSYLRVPMGASDFALSTYTYNDLPAGQTDPTLSQFSIAHDRAYIIPTLQQAVAINPQVKMMATPWSAPAWMKNGGSLFGGSLNSQHYGTYADYFVKFLQAYEAEGLSFDTVTPQNEPLFTSSNYPTMSMSTFQQSTFIGDHLGPAFDAANIDTKIVAFDHNWSDWNYPVVIMNDNEAEQHATGAAFHGYAGNVSEQSNFHNFFPDKDVYFTEITGGDFAPNFDDNLVWSLRNIIIGGTRNWSRTAIYWNIALDENHGPRLPNTCPDCRGMVTIDSNTGDVEFSEDYYAYAHASKFVDPGAIRIESDTVSNVVETVAFRNPDGSEVLIALNPTNSTRQFDIVRHGKFFVYSLAKQSVATFVWAAPLPADFDGDGDTDLDDFNILATNFGTTSGASITQGDADGDGDVDLDDFNLLAADFGSNPQESISAVPEPGVSLMLALGSLGVFRMRFN